MANFTISQKYVSAPRNAWTGVEKIPLDVSGADGVGLASTLKTYVNSTNLIKLTGSQQYYVATTGNDTTGTGAIGAPWASLQKAWEYICLNLDLAGQGVIVNVAAGSYGPTEDAAHPVLALSNRVPVGGYGSWQNGPTGSGKVTFAGVAADRTLVKLVGTSINRGSCIYSYSQLLCPVIFQDMQLIGPATNVANVDQSNVFLEDCALVEFVNCDCSGGNDQYLIVHTHVRIYGTYSILAANSRRHLYASQLAEVEYFPDAAIFPGAVNFAVAFAVAISNSWIVLWASAYTNAVNCTGTKFLAFSSGIIEVLDVPLASIPGDVAGNTTGGFVTSYIGSEAFRRGASLSVEYIQSTLPNATDIVDESFAYFYNIDTARANVYFNDEGTVRILGREKLWGDATFYIATTGSDTTGVGSSGNPWKSPQHAWNWISQNIDQQGYTITISVGAGTYHPLIADTPVLNTSLAYANPLPAPIGSGLIKFVGQSDRTLVKWSNLSSTDLTVVTLDGFGGLIEFHNIQMFSATASGTGGLFGGDAYGAFIELFSCDMGPSRGSHIFAGDYTNLWVHGPYSILGGASGGAHLYAGGIHSTIIIEGTVTVAVSSTFPDSTTGFPATATNFVGFVTCIGTGLMLLAGPTFVNPGNVVGTKFYLQGGQIETQLGNTLGGVLPGTLAGVMWPQGRVLTDGNFYGHVSSVNIKAGLPVAGDMDPDCWSVWRNSSDGKCYLVTNSGGTIKKVELI
jgi:hypothetical protein